MIQLPQVNGPEIEKKILKSSILSVVDFRAPGCSPCKRSAPFLKKIAG